MRCVPTCLVRLAAVAGLAVACIPPASIDPATGSFSFQCEQGENALAQGRLENAESFLARAQKLASLAGRGSPEQARVNLALAKLRRMRGDLRKARHYLGLARFGTRTAHGQRSLEMAQVELEGARQLQAAGLHDQAVAAVEEALRIQKALLPPTDPLLEATLGELGWAHLLAFQYPRAVDIYRRSLETMRSRSAPNRDRIVLLNRLAWIHERAALGERADELHAKARRIVAEETLGGGTSEALLTLGIEGLPLADERRETMEELKALGLAWIADRGYHPEHFDLERNLLVSLRRLDREVPLPKVRQGLIRDLSSEFLDFAPARPRRDSRHLYGLPFEAGTTRRTARTSEGAHGYQREYLNAVDFELPAGSAVVAGRGGRVVRVVDGFGATMPGTGGPGGDPRHGMHVNRVVVLHDDDTYATYLPLGEVWVAEGEEIARGQRLGSVAAPPAGEKAVVHFDVRRNATSTGSGGRLTPEPVRAHFADVPHRGGIPLAEHSYTAGPATAPARAAD